MVTMQDILEQLMGKQIVRELELYLEEYFESFTTTHEKYISTVSQLRKELGTSVLPSVDDLVDAIDVQAASSLFFSAFLGIKSNLDHFRDPMARTVLDVDYPVFLQEDTAIRLPEYVKSQATIDSFVSLLTPEQIELFDNIIEYISYLEAMGPKLAHYFGYILGNNLLRNLIPGYYSDEVLTMNYSTMLKTYLGKLVIIR